VLLLVLTLCPRHAVLTVTTPGHAPCPAANSTSAPAVTFRQNVTFMASKLTFLVRRYPSADSSEGPVGPYHHQHSAPSSQGAHPLAVCHTRTAGNYVIRCVIHCVIHYVIHCVTHCVIRCVIHYVIHCVIRCVIHCVIHCVIYCVRIRHSF
jgi:hypothetical protein